MFLIKKTKFNGEFPKIVSNQFIVDLHVTGKSRVYFIIEFIESTLFLNRTL